MKEDRVWGEMSDIRTPKFGGEGWMSPCFLGDDLQDVEDQLHDDGALTQLTGPAVNDGDQSAVQVAQVLRQERLAVTSCQITHLPRLKMDLASV